MHTVRILPSRPGGDSHGSLKDFLRDSFKDSSHSSLTKPEYFIVIRTNYLKESLKDSLKDYLKHSLKESLKDSSHSSLKKP